MDLSPVVAVSRPFFVMSIIVRYSIFNKLSLVRNMVLDLVTFRSWRLNPSVAFVV